MYSCLPKRSSLSCNTNECLICFIDDIEILLPTVGVVVVVVVVVVLAVVEVLVVVVVYENRKPGRVTLASELNL